jgi:predicted DNA-binding transcriptional regulator AlpA
MPTQLQTAIRGNRETRRVAASAKSQKKLTSPMTAERLAELTDGNPLHVLTPEELCEALQIGRRTLFTWMGEGLAPPRIAIGHGRKVRFSVPVVLKWLQEHQTPVLPPPRTRGRPTKRG